jgi:hypothetical protein
MGEPLLDTSPSEATAGGTFLVKAVGSNVSGVGQSPSFFISGALTAFFVALYALASVPPLRVTSVAITR